MENEKRIMWHAEFNESFPSCELAEKFFELLQLFDFKNAYSDQYTACRVIASHLNESMNIKERES